MFQLFFPLLGIMPMKVFVIIILALCIRFQFTYMIPGSNFFILFSVICPKYLIDCATLSHSLLTSSQCLCLSFVFFISPDHDENKISIKFLLSNAEAGSIIGKGGSTISDFQARSGARIQLSRNNEFFPGTMDRIVMVSGPIDDVLKAVDLVLNKLLDEVISRFESHSVYCY